MFSAIRSEEWRKCLQKRIMKQRRKDEDQLCCSRFLVTFSFFWRPADKALNSVWTMVFYEHWPSFLY